jgi:hypothetical protein
MLERFSADPVFSIMFSVRLQTGTCLLMAGTARCKDNNYANRATSQSVYMA